MVDLRNNPSRQLAALRKLVRFTAFLSFPLVLGFGLVSREFILITLTEKWLQSASYLEILCIGGAFLPISTLLSDFIISQGRSGVYLGSTVTLGLLQIVSMVVLYPLGIRTMIVGAVTINIVWSFVWLLLGGRLIGYRLALFLPSWPPRDGSPPRSPIPGCCSSRASPWLPCSTMPSCAWRAQRSCGNVWASSCTGSRRTPLPRSPPL